MAAFTDVGQIILQYSYGGIQPEAQLSTSYLYVGDMAKPFKEKPGSLVDKFNKAAPNNQSPSQSHPSKKGLSL